MFCFSIFTQINESLKSSDQEKLDAQTCDAYCASLHRLDTDIHKKAYPYVPERTVTGLDRVTLRELNSTVALQQMRQDARPAFAKFKDRVRYMLSRKG